MRPFDRLCIPGLMLCPIEGVRFEDRQPRNSLLERRPIKRAKDLYMSEVRQSLDGRRDFLPSSGATKPSSRVVQLSLADAVAAAIAGGIDPKTIYKQMPSQVRCALEEFTKTKFGKGMDALSEHEDRELLLLLQGAAKKEPRQDVTETPRRSECRIDSSRDYFPSQSIASSPRHSRKVLLVVVGALLLVVLFGGLWWWRFA